MPVTLSLFLVSAPVCLVIIVRHLYRCFPLVPPLPGVQRQLLHCFRTCPTNLAPLVFPFHHPHLMSIYMYDKLEIGVFGH